MNSIPVLQAKKIAKTFSEGKLYTSVLDEIDFTVQEGERIAIIGSSGSGKSTLLQLLGGLEKPSRGTVLIKGIDINKLSSGKLSRLRNQYMGFVYQFHHLLPEFSAIENISMPLLIAKMKPRKALEKAHALLEKVGLADRAIHKVAELSGGERQRVAIARALVAGPHCVLADEPTGNLDPQTADNVYGMMLSLNQSLNTSLVIVTHDMKLAQKMDKIYKIDNKKLYPL